MNLRRCLCKKSPGHTLICRFILGINSIHRRKMEQILLAYSLPPKTVTAIVMLNKNIKVKVQSLDGDRLLWHCCLCSERGYISPISVHNLLRLYTSNIDKCSERKWFYTKKGKKQMIPYTNYYEHRLCRWHSASGKYTNPSQIPTAKSGAGIRLHRAPCKCRQNRVHVF